MSPSESETEESSENASDLPRKADLEDQFTRGTNGSGGKSTTRACSLATTKMVTVSHDLFAFTPTLGENARANSNLQHAQAHTGGVAGFAAGDHRDMADIGFGANSALGYIRNNSDTIGVFPASDSIQSAKIAPLGQYMATSFVSPSNRHGEALVSDPPLTAHPLLSLPHGAQPPRGLR
jgi:hypothetical protein